MNNIESPNNTDSSIEQEIQAKGKTAPRVTQADFDANIISSEIVKHVSPSGQILRWAVITTASGFAVTGDPSAAVSAENDDASIGERIAIDNARNKLWPMMGYELKQRLHEVSNGNLVRRIARMCHEVNKAYCEALGDFSQPAWEDAPQWQKDSAITGVCLHMINPDAGPQASHESWMAQKVDDGWVYGAVKRPEAKEHPCIVPFADLPTAQQAKDFIFRAVVHAAVADAP
jgi:hypothetical protein